MDCIMVTSINKMKNLILYQHIKLEHFYQNIRTIILRLYMTYIKIDNSETISTISIIIKKNKSENI